MTFWIFFVRRLLQTFLILLGAISLLFVLFQAVGGDPALLHAGKNADTATVELLRHQMGFDQSVVNQYVQFLKDSIFLDFGLSWSTQRPVMGLIVEGLVPTFFLVVISFSMTCVLSLALAFLAVHYRFRWFEKGLNLLVAVLMSLSFIIIILFMQNFFAYTLNWFPVFGWESGLEGWRYMMLPCLVSVVGSFSPKFLIFRTLILEEVEKTYVRTALSKGLSWQRIYFRHILKNVSPAMITLLASQIPTLFTGYMLLEIFFGIPGLGHLLLKSIQSSDFPTVKALTVLGALVYILFVFISDTLAQWLTPKSEAL